MAPPKPPRSSALPPLPRTSTISRQPSAPELSGIFPDDRTPGALFEASKNQAAFLWFYSSEITGRVERVETKLDELRADQAAEAEKNEAFRADLAARELARERRDAERRSVKFWFAWLLPVATGLLGVAGSEIVKRLFH